MWLTSSLYSYIQDTKNNLKNQTDAAKETKINLTYLDNCYPEIHCKVQTSAFKIMHFRGSHLPLSRHASRISLFQLANLPKEGTSVRMIAWKMCYINASLVTFVLFIFLLFSGWEWVILNTMAKLRFQMPFNFLLKLTWLFCNLVWSLAACHALISEADVKGLLSTP